MDVDVEMVERRGDDGDEIVAAENFRDTDIVDNPIVRRQNICFLVAMFSCLVGFSVYVVGRIYMFSFEDGVFGGMGSNSGEVDSNDKVTQVSIVKGKYAHSHGRGWSKTHPKQHGDPNSSYVDPESSHVEPESSHVEPESSHDKPESTYVEPESTYVDAKVHEWLNASVTIDDGIMYEVVAQLYHDKTAFTEGLCFVNGRLFESTGIENESMLKELDPETGHPIDHWPINPKDFGEGLTFANGYLIQLTWQQKKGYKYDIKNLSAAPEEFVFTSTSGEGWGLTYDRKRNELIESDGSNFLNFWDPETMEQLRNVEVYRMDGKKAKRINELEMWRDRVLANIWYEDTIIVINPETGEVEKEYDFGQLWTISERRKQGADVLNGISISDVDDLLYVTGKNWDRMFKIRLLP